MASFDFFIVCCFSIGAIFLFAETLSKIWWDKREKRNNLLIWDKIREVHKKIWFVPDLKSRRKALNKLLTEGFDGKWLGNWNEWLDAKFAEQELFERIEYEGAIIPRENELYEDIKKIWQDSLVTTGK